MFEAMWAAGRVALERGYGMYATSRAYCSGLTLTSRALYGARRFDVLDVHRAGAESAERHQRSSPASESAQVGVWAKEAAITPPECEPLEAARRGSACGPADARRSSRCCLRAWAG